MSELDMLPEKPHPVLSHAQIERTTRPISFSEQLDFDSMASDCAAPIGSESNFCLQLKSQRRCRLRILSMNLICSRGGPLGLKGYNPECTIPRRILFTNIRATRSLTTSSGMSDMHPRAWYAPSPHALKLRSSPNLIQSVCG